MTTIEAIREIVYKECERYRLTNSKFISDRDEAVAQLHDQISEPLPTTSYNEFVEWKRRALNKFYTLNKYSIYATKNREQIYSLAYSLSRGIVAAMKISSDKKREKTIDDELRISINEIESVAFKLSQAIFEILFEDIYPEKQIFFQPDQIEDRCQRVCGELYPLSYRDFYNRLRENDSEFWDDVWKMIYHYMKAYLTKRGVTINREDIRSEVASEAIISFREQLLSSKLEGVESASHLINSMHRTCIYKYQECYHAKSNKKEDILDDKEWNRLNAKEIDEEQVDHIDEESAKDRLSIRESLISADPTIHDEVSLIMIDILAKRQEPFFSLIVGSNLESAEILIKHYFDGMSYDEIAEELSTTANPKSSSTLRQNVSRVKDRLWRETKKLIEKHQKQQRKKIYSYEKSV